MSNLFAFMMPGAPELLIIGIIAVLLFGSRLPKLAYSMGNSYTQFKQGLSETTSEISSCKDKINAGRDAVQASIEKDIQKVKASVDKGVQSVKDSVK